MLAAPAEDLPGGKGTGTKQSGYRDPGLTGQIRVRRLLRQPGRLAALADRGQSKMCTGNVLSLSGVISLRRKFHPGSFRLAARSTMRREGEKSHRVALGDAEPCEHGSDATTAPPTVLSTVFMPVATLVCSALTFSMIKLGIAVKVRP